MRIKSLSESINIGVTGKQLPKRLIGWDRIVDDRDFAVYQKEFVTINFVSVQIFIPRELNELIINVLIDGIPVLSDEKFTFGSIVAAASIAQSPSYLIDVFRCLDDLLSDLIDALEEDLETNGIINVVYLNSSIVKKDVDRFKRDAIRQIATIIKNAK